MAIAGKVGCSIGCPLKSLKTNGCSVFDVEEIDPFSSILDFSFSYPIQHIASWSVETGKPDDHGSIGGPKIFLCLDTR
jgi:hypothetical protein